MIAAELTAGVFLAGHRAPTKRVRQHRRQSAPLWTVVTWTDGAKAWYRPGDEVVLAPALDPAQTRTDLIPDGPRRVAALTLQGGRR